MKKLLIVLILINLAGCGGGGNSSPVVPILASISNQSANQGVNKIVTGISASNFSGNVTYTLTSNPISKVSGSVSGSTLTLTPLASYSGTAVLTLTASDGASSNSKSFNLVITANDPLYQYQWHLNNTGQTNFSNIAGIASQDINVDGTIADGYTGSGVIVAVIDTGLEIAHEDLSANVVSGGSWDFYGNDTDPTKTVNSTEIGDHGTSAAGVIAAVGWNGKGGRGVAPSASLKGFNLICPSCSQSVADNVNALGGASYSSDVDIFSQNYGTPFNAVNAGFDSVINSSIEAQYLTGVTSLRSGKGAIYVKSSGRGFTSLGSSNRIECENTYSSNTDILSCENANMRPKNTLPYNIVVGSLSAKGLKSSHSTAGSALWISAPGGEYGYHSSIAGNGTGYGNEPAMMTTDQSTCSMGIVSSNSRRNSFDDKGTHSENPNCNYTSGFKWHTAAPVVSGAIALILEANPALTWRDVKHILATNSDQVDASVSNTSITINGVAYVAEPSWLTNGAGHKFHNYYGFGRINVGAAITAAKSYTTGSLATFATTSWQSSGTLNTSITDNNATGISNVITVSGVNTIEAVQIKINASHTATGDLAIELTSPAGTKSVLMNPWNAFGTSNDLTNMVLLSNAFYGESKAGNWTIKVIDAVSGNNGTLTNWSIRFFGH